MAVSNPTALDVLEEEGIERAAIETQPYAPNAQDFESHVRTYRDFIRGITIFVALAAFILITLAFFFA